MLVVMKPQATPEEIQAVCQQIEKLGFRAHPLPGAQRTAIGVTGNEGQIERGNLEELQGVAEAATRKRKTPSSVFPARTRPLVGANLPLLPDHVAWNRANRLLRSPKR